MEPILPSVPKNGAVLVRKASPLDVSFLMTLSEGVQFAARAQEAAGDDVDDVEFSSVQGTYDWRAYIREEFALARNRFLEEGDA